MSHVCPGEDFDLFNSWLQQKLTGVVGVAEIKPVTPKMLLVYYGPAYPQDFSKAVLRVSEDAQKDFAPLFNHLRSRDQAPAIQAFKGISETSSLAELKSAQAIFTTTRNEFQQVSEALSGFLGNNPVQVRHFQDSIEASWGKGGYDTLTRFLKRGSDDEAIVRKLGEVVNKADKEKTKTVDENKEKEKDKQSTVVLTKEQVYITFETGISSAVLLLKSHIDNKDLETEIKAGDGGVVTATGRDGNPTSNPIALYVSDGTHYVVTGGLSLKGDGSGHIVSADTGNSHLTVTQGKDAQHFSIAWDGKTQTSSP